MRGVCFIGSGLPWFSPGRGKMFVLLSMKSCFSLFPVAAFHPYQLLALPFSPAAAEPLPPKLLTASEAEGLKVTRLASSSLPPVCLIPVFFLAMLSLATALPSAAADDALEFVGGAKVTGTVVRIRKEARELDFEAKVGERALTRTYRFSQLHAVTMKGKRYVLTPRPGNTAPGDNSSSPRSGATRSRAEVDRLIDDRGNTPPDWFESTPLNYPETMDLEWPKVTEPWNPRVNPGQFMWSSVNENPRRWKEGAKFMHHVLSVNRGRPEIEQQAFGQLGHCYHALLGDWARAAFWWRKLDRQDMHTTIGLADCYWKLGCKEMAVEKLRAIRSDTTRYGSFSAARLRANLLG